MNHNTKVLLLAVLVLGVLFLSCGDPPVKTPCDELKGTARFTEKAVDRCGCPEPELVPVWMEIPECSG